MFVLNALMKKAPCDILREFARKCALRHVQKIKPYCSDEDYDLIVKWLETGDESLRQGAFLAAESAVDSAANSADWAAEWAAREAAELAAKSVYFAAKSAELAAEWAIKSAYWAAYWAAYSAAESVAYRWIKSAAESARDAEIEWQEQTLSEMMRESNYE